LTWGNTASVEVTRVRHRESPDVLFAKTMPKVRIDLLQEKERREDLPLLYVTS
jgi:hypothetical protein